MRMLRWASGLAVEADVGRSDVGVAALEALEGSELLQPDDQALITALLAVVLDSVVERYDVDVIVEEVD